MFYTILREELKNGGIAVEKIENVVAIVQECEIK